MLQHKNFCPGWVGNWVELTKGRIKDSYYSLILSHTVGGLSNVGRELEPKILRLDAQLWRLEDEINTVVAERRAELTYYI